MEQEIKLYIRYQENQESDFGNLAYIGESLIGFDKLLKDFVKLLGIRGDVEIKAKDIKQGSIIFELGFDFIQTIVNSDIFSSPEYYKDFMKFVGEYTKGEARKEYVELKDDFLRLNNFYKEYPLAVTLIGAAFVKLLKIYPKINRKLLENQYIPQKILDGFKEIRKKGALQKVLKPIIEENVSSIEVYSNHSTKEKDSKVVIGQENYEYYLVKGDEILPELDNGSFVKKVGQIVGLTADPGDYVKLKIYDYEKVYKSFQCLPGGQSTTSDYTKFYKENAILDLEVYRQSKYRKPKFIIHDISYYQGVLPFLQD